MTHNYTQYQCCVLWKLYINIMYHGYIPGIYVCKTVMDNRHKYRLSLMSDIKITFCKHQYFVTEFQIYLTRDIFWVRISNILFLLVKDTSTFVSPSLSHIAEFNGLSFLYLMTLQHFISTIAGLGSNLPLLIANTDEVIFDLQFLTTEVVGFSCPANIDPKSLSAKFLPFPRFPSGDCSTYLICVDGYPRRIGCGDYQVFDESTLSCQDPEHVPKW